MVPPHLPHSRSRQLSQPYLCCLLLVYLCCLLLVYPALRLSRSLCDLDVIYVHTIRSKETCTIERVSILIHRHCELWCEARSTVNGIFVRNVTWAFRSTTARLLREMLAHPLHSDTPYDTTSYSSMRTRSHSMLHRTYVGSQQIPLAKDQWTVRSYRRGLRAGL